jgi:hypothetical protein
MDTPRQPRPPLVKENAAIIIFMNRALIAAALAATLTLAGCHKDIQTTDAVQRGITTYLASKPGLSAMDVSVTSVSFRQNEADATVHFQARGSTDAASGISMKYILERKGNDWVVKGREGVATGANPHGDAANPHGDMGGMGANPHGGGMPALPPGHPAIPPDSQMTAPSK